MNEEVRTTLDPAFELIVNNLVKEQFPAIFRDVAPVFVEFAREYYQYLESYKQPVWYARRWPQLNDIDETIDSFLLFFKNKYLKNIQLETTTDVRMMIKHCLDIYRAKGTPQAIDLLFRLVFGVGADVYLPRTDLLQPSSGTWVVPRYLEISSRPNLDNAKFVGRQIVGSETKATAFVERLVRKRINSTFVEVLYISAINGKFETGEKINISIGTPFDYAVCPNVIGSLTELIVTDGAQGFEIGDTVQLKGLSGIGGIGRVTAVSNNSGTVTYTLIDGGWGYTSHTEVLVTDHILTITNPEYTFPFTANYYFQFAEQITQPTAQLSYLNANGTLAVGANVFNYFANGSVAGKGVILSATPSNSTAGQLLVSVLSGNLQNLGFFTTSNTIGANLAIVGGYTDQTATALVISQSSNCSILCTNTTAAFTVGEIITNSKGSRAVVAKSGDLIGSTVTLNLQNTYNMFALNDVITGTVSGAQASINSLSIFVGVTSTNGAFNTTPNNYTYGTCTNTTGSVTSISIGTGAGVNISSLFLEIESDDVSCETFVESGNVVVSAAAYGMSNASANGGSNTPISILHATLNVGGVAALISENPGQNYSIAPTVRIYDPCIMPFNRRGWAVNYTGATASFQPGEIVTQAATNASGMVLPSTNSSMLYLKRLSLYTNISNTTNSTTTIVGTSSGAKANVLSSGIDWTYPEYDIGAIYCGLNALIQTNTVIGIGSATNLTVIDSGFAYQEGEQVNFFVTAGSNTGAAKVELGTQGQGSGYYKDRNGWLSSEKKLFDGDYWQYFSYEIRSSLAIERYEKIVNEVLHIAGMKFFGALYHATANKVTLTSQPTTVVITPPNVDVGTGDAIDSGAQWFFFFN